ncbi:MAG: FAD-binding oxidoreductase [Ardenticatenaceae bacterium]|nr:FAD-binding oxidoreductase [Ardenticatenaceae bacterium]
MADKSLDKNSNLKDVRYDHKWGFNDTRFQANPDRTVTVTGDRYAISGTTMPGFIPFVEEMLDIKFDMKDLKPELEVKPVPEPIVNEAFCRAVAKAFAPDRFTADRRERLIHSHGQTTADELNKVLYSHLERYADLVFYPQSHDECVQLVQLAAEHDVCLVPYGGGTSVSCALLLPAAETRMIVSVDMRRMNKIEWVDHENFRASIEAGITGKDLEEELAKLGYTSGHEPDSMELSTLGGWIATNASGMKKNRYGNIEQIVEGITMITPQGIVEQLDPQPRVSIGIQPNGLLFGSEGNLGLITKAIIRIHKIPPVKKYGSLVFRDFKTGTAFLYELSQTGVLPASIRLVDNIQFRFGSALKPVPTASEHMMDRIQKFFLLKVMKFDPHQLVAATIVMEGTADEVAHQEKTIYKIAKKYGGIKGGEGNGKRGYMLTYAIAYIRDFLADFHITGETYETTVPWSRVHEVIATVEKLAFAKHKEFGLPGKPYVSPRITQLYHTGVCIYFTHGFYTKGVKDPDKIFSAIEKDLRRAILDAGGSLSHHHGIGKLRNEFMARTISPASAEMIKELKQASDPQNVFGIRNNVLAE